MTVTRLADLSGTWRLTRSVEDALAGEIGQLTGEATFTDRGSDWLYEETGILRLPGRTPLNAQRRYLFIDEGAGASVCFADGRPFHRFSWINPNAVHDCPPDKYLVNYEFSDFPTWTSRWHVRGPRKNYIMTSIYARP